MFRSSRKVTPQARVPGLESRISGKPKELANRLVSVIPPLALLRNSEKLLAEGNLVQN